MNSDMVEVSQDVFFALIGPLDVTPRVMGEWGTPEYRSDFVTPYGELRGRCVDTCLCDGTPDRYFLTEALAGSARAKACVKT